MCMYTVQKSSWLVLGPARLLADLCCMCVSIYRISHLAKAQEATKPHDSPGHPGKVRSFSDLLRHCMVHC